jgi:hypothetical protein
MHLKKSFRRFPASVCNARFLFFTAALMGVIFLALSGISHARSQPQAQQLSSKAGEAYIRVTSQAKNEVWEKGKRYTINWESKGILANVRILLVSEDVKRFADVKGGGVGQVIQLSARPFELAKHTFNNGIYVFIVPSFTPDGTYKVQVMTIDGSIKAQSAGTVTIIEQKTAGAKAASQQEREKAAAADQSKAQAGAAAAAGAAPAAKMGAGQATQGAAATSAGAAAATGTTASTAGAAAKGATPSAAVAGKSIAAAEKIVRGQVQSVKVSEATLNNFKFQASTASAPDYKIGGHSTTGGKIEVYSPRDGEIWEAEKEYGIRWKSTGITGDVKITLAYGLVVGGKRTEYPIAERTADTGSYLFRVPRNWFPQNQPFHVRVSTLDGSVSGFSPGGIKVYTQYVDLVCMIVDPAVWEQPTSYVLYAKYKRWFEFNVWWKNNGTRFVKQIWPVLVRIIKEPEELVCYQEEWGVGDVYPYAWYQLPEPRRFDIKSWTDTLGIDFDKHVDLEKGAYRVEVVLDTHNYLGEDEQLRDNNKAVVRWSIK